jgi:hypothetical protein
MRGSNEFELRVKGRVKDKMELMVVEGLVGRGFDNFIRGIFLDRRRPSQGMPLVATWLSGLVAKQKVAVEA